MDAEEEELQRQIAEAMRRSQCETTREESEIADALAASMISHDEELARAMQREQVQEMEANLCPELAGKSAQTTTASPRTPPRDSSCQRPDSPKMQKFPSPAAPSERSPSSPIRNYLHSNTAFPLNSTHHASIPSRQRTHSSPTSNTYAAAAASQHNASSPRQHTRGTVLQDPTFAGRYRAHGTPPQSRPEAPPEPFVRDNRTPEVVIDGQNIACGYGGGKYKFRAHGIELVLDYYRFRDIPAVAMLPEHKVDQRDAHRSHVADDPDLLLRLKEQGRVAFTPAGAHDDYFLLRYAMQVDADLVSNDKFRKELDMQETVQDARNLRGFLDLHLIPYTFVAGEFVPNPRPSQLSQDIHQSRTMRR